MYTSAELFSEYLMPNRHFCPYILTSEPVHMQNHVTAYVKPVKLHNSLMPYKLVYSSLIDMKETDFRTTYTRQKLISNNSFSSVHLIIRNSEKRKIF